MTKITFIGAGSLDFTTELVRDILTFPRLQDATISLMDIDAERLEWAEKRVMKLVEAGDHPTKVEASLDRVEALKGADVVLTTILAGTTEVWRHDIEIPKKYGIDTNVGDTRGPSGIFRFLRTINPMMDIVRDMEKHCPNAVLLNYTNPMAMLVSALQKQTFIEVTGLCHSVQGTAMMLADWIGAPHDEIDYLCAGINHQCQACAYYGGKERAQQVPADGLQTDPAELADRQAGSAAEQGKEDYRYDDHLEHVHKDGAKGLYEVEDSEGGVGFGLAGDQPQSPADNGPDNEADDDPGNERDAEVPR